MKEKNMIESSPAFIQWLCVGRRCFKKNGAERKTGNITFIWISTGLKKYQTVILSNSGIVSHTRKSTINGEGKWQPQG